MPTIMEATYSDPATETTGVATITKATQVT
jgi:hypothetical protein